jgi:hypothetical protein
MYYESDSVEMTAVSNASSAESEHSVETTTTVNPLVDAQLEMTAVSNATSPESEQFVETTTTTNPWVGGYFEVKSMGNATSVDNATSADTEHRSFSRKIVHAIQTCFCCL